jgi:phenylalanyl-tRNA synthetase beta chain
VALRPDRHRLPGGLEIAARELRGVASHGMICSETELDVGATATGSSSSREFARRRLAPTLVPGIVDTILEINVTPNRPDALGHIGVARDVAAKLRGTLRLPPPLRLAPAAQPEIPRDELVTIAAAERCGRYLGYVLEDVKVGPSPLWLRVCLHRLGLRPISNVVDITNYVLLEAGQPLHAFDRAKLAEGRVVVRLAATRRACSPSTADRSLSTPQTS